MATEAEHVFITEFPSVAMSTVGKAIVNRALSPDLAFPIVKITEFAVSKIVGDEPGAKKFEPETELTHEQIGHILVAAADDYDAHLVSGVVQDVQKLPWKSILAAVTKILLGILLAAEPTVDPASS